MSFELLLDELENLHDERGNPLGPLLRKAHIPAKPAPVRVTRITRSEPVSFSQFAPQRSVDTGDMAELDRAVSSMNKSMATTRTVTRSCKPDMRKMIASFSANLTKSLKAGEIPPDVARRLETERNNLVQTAADRGLL